MTLHTRLMRAARAALVLLPVGAHPLHAQLRLADALRRADTAAVANRAAAGVRMERDGAALAPLRGILPALHVDASAVRTTDPIGAFGTTLRQRRITPADFNPASLNYPAAVTNLGTAVVAELPLFNADAWTGRAAARHAAGAGLAAADWSRFSTRADVVRAYYGVLVADEMVRALESAARAGQAHLRQAESLQRNGIVTPSDALLAAVKAGEVESDLASARGNLAIAGHGLALLLGDDGRAAIRPAGALPSAAALRAFAALDTTVRSVPRRDVTAAELGAAAANADHTRARALLLPRLNGFARYDWNDPLRLAGGDKNWTVGLMATWSPFTGASEVGEQRATAGRAATARAMADGAAAQADFDAQRTTTDLRVALMRLDIAERSVVQAADAHRIVSRRYDGGLASVTELFDAAAAESHAATMFAKSRFDVAAALAARRLALGLDPGALTALEATDAMDSRTQTPPANPDR